MPWEAAIVLAGLGTLALTAYVVHARRAAFPLLDLELLSIKTFRASVAGGSLFRIGIGSIPFLLPLMLQAGFGMTAFQSGSVTFIASVGAMAMKATAAPILRIFGFRRVLVYNAIVSAACLGFYGFFTPSTPLVFMMSLASLQRLRAVARIHQHQRNCLCRNRFRQNERGRQFCFSRPAIVFERWRRGRSRRPARACSRQPRVTRSRPCKFQMGLCRDGGGLVERGFRFHASARGCRIRTYPPLGESRASDRARGAISALLAHRLPAPLNPVAST